MGIADVGGGGWGYCATVDRSRLILDSPLQIPTTHQIQCARVSGVSDADADLLFSTTHGNQRKLRSVPLPTSRSCDDGGSVVLWWCGDMMIA